MAVAPDLVSQKTQQSGLQVVGLFHFLVGDVVFWHEPDLQRCPQFGRYREESGLSGAGPITKSRSSLAHESPTVLHVLKFHRRIS